jgi:ParB family chromosome partitioning protein
VPCHERPDLAADSDQVLAMLVENLRRDDLTEVEEARGYQQLLDLGLSATKIAKATGTSRTRVRDALAVTKSDRALNTAAAHGLTLDQALVLTEFDGEDEALDALTETAVEPRRPAARRLPHPPGPRPPGPVRAARRRARSGRRHDPGHQRPENYGTKALSVPRGLDALTDGDGQDLDPEQHRSCPGHAVWIETYSWQAPRATYA